MSTPSSHPVTVHAGHGAPFPRPVGGIGTAAAVLVAVAAVAQAITVTRSGWVMYSTLARFQGGGGGYAQSISAIKSAQLGQGAAMLLNLAAGIVFLVWLVRARRNAELISPDAPFRLGAGWAVGGWFVPLANVVLPLLVVTDTWRASVRGTRPAGVVGAWWVSLSASWALYWVAGLVRTFGGSDGRASAAANAFLLMVVQSGLTLVAGALAVAVVRRISAAQEPAAPAAPAAPVDGVVTDPGRA